MSLTTERLLSPVEAFVSTYHSRICRAKFPGGMPKRTYKSGGKPNRSRICCWV